MVKEIKTRIEKIHKSGRIPKTAAGLYGKKKITLMGKIMKIEAIKERYKDTWLAIRVSKFSKDQVPEEGELIAQSDNREELWKQVPKNTKDTIYITYSGDYLKKGYAAAF